ncbi:hypothetical protein CDAR_268861 [Caerostris darwini]|uniref:Uncharacterized protein n=1 Tax=Caerostris darwini TaxID=1538125 RepID=A0AAV4V4D3_9ARAC|nr:hypothetical protein CDAR_268861 [Caerostris darwini]
MGHNVELYRTCSSFSAVFIMGKHLGNFRNLSQSSVFQSWARQEEQRPLQDVYGKWYCNACLFMKHLPIRNSVAERVFLVTKNFAFGAEAAISNFTNAHFKICGVEKENKEGILC